MFSNFFYMFKVVSGPVCESSFTPKKFLELLLISSRKLQKTGQNWRKSRIFKNSWYQEFFSPKLVFWSKKSIFVNYLQTYFTNAGQFLNCSSTVLQLFSIVFLSCVHCSSTALQLFFNCSSTVLPRSFFLGRTKDVFGQKLLVPGVFKMGFLPYFLSFFDDYLDNCSANYKIMLMVKQNWYFVPKPTQHL